MVVELNAQPLGHRSIVESLDREFARLYSRSRTLIENTPPDRLYEARARLSSVGESVLRSAAAVEQTFGGLTSNLWDDPFEWTLPEHLSTPDRVIDHLDEVEALRNRAFVSFTDDACLLKHVATPAGGTCALMELLLETLVRAAEFQGQATQAKA